MKLVLDNATYSDSKDLARRTVSDKILNNRAYEIGINSKYEWLIKRISKYGV